MQAVVEARLGQAERRAQPRAAGADHDDVEAVIDERIGSSCAAAGRERARIARRAPPLPPGAAIATIQQRTRACSGRSRSPRPRPACPGPSARARTSRTAARRHRLQWFASQATTDPCASSGREQERRHEPEPERHERDCGDALVAPVARPAARSVHRHASQRPPASAQSVAPNARAANSDHQRAARRAAGNSKPKPASQTRCRMPLNR